MRRKKGVEANIRFLFGSVFFFFIIVIVIGLFSYFTLQQYWSGFDNKKKTSVVSLYDYSIKFDKGFRDKSYRVYLNDSLIYAGIPVNVDTVLMVKRTLEHNSLLIVDDKTDIIVSVIELGKRNNVLLNNKSGVVSFDIEKRF